MPPPPRRNKRKTFFVDTKTTCFLCLQEIPPLPPSPPLVIDLESEDEDQEHSKDIKILGDGSGGNHVKLEEKKEVPEARSKLCLRTICKFLKLNPGDLLSSSVSGGTLMDSLRPQLENTDLLVSLCNNCNKITTVISKQISELEVIQMKVDYSLKGLVDVLKNAKDNPSRMEHFQKKMENPLEQLHAFVAETVREETEKKVSNHLKMSIPKVNVGKIVLPPKNLMTGDTSKLVQLATCKCNICGFAFVSRNGLTQHKKTKHGLVPAPTTTSTPTPDIIPVNLPTIHQPQIYNCKACGSKLPSKTAWIRHTRLYCHRRGGGTTIAAVTIKKEFLAQAPPPPPTVSNSTSDTIAIPTDSVLTEMMNPVPCIKTADSKLQCSLCLPNSITFNMETQLRSHLFYFHIDYFFTPVKLEELSTKQFKELCEKLISDEILLSAQRDSNLFPQNTVPFTCQYCSREFNSFERGYINAHLIQSHYQLLASKLVDLQRNNALSLSPPKPQRNFGADVQARRRFKCPDCGGMFVQKPSLNRHRLKYCKGQNGVAPTSTVRLSQPLAITPAARPPPPSLVITPIKRPPPPNVHIFPVFNQEEAPAPNIPIYQPRRPRGESADFKCLECGAGFAHSGSLWRHRRQQKHMIGYIAPPPTRRSPKVFCDFCGNGFSEPRYLKRHLNRTACAERRKQAEAGVSQDNTGNITVTSSFSMASTINPSPPPLPQPTVPPSFVISLDPFSMGGTRTAQTQVTSQEAQWSSCEYCGKAFSSSCVRRRHERQNCPQAKAAREQLQLSGPAFIEQEYYQEENGVQMEEGGEEEEMEGTFEESYVNTKIEIFEMSQVHLSHSGGEDGDNMFSAGADNYEGNEMDYSGQDDSQPSGEGDNIMMMIIPDGNDPLQF